MERPKVCILRTAGTNCDKETAFAFSKAGALTELIHINRFFQQQNRLNDYQILAIPGGFSYGDDIAAGKILANELRYKLKDDMRKFIRDGKLIIGICNGFQVLVKSGLLPGNDDLTQEASLIINDSGKFEDRWVYLKLSAVNCQLSAKCVWTSNLPGIIYLPVAHGEGKFITKDKSVLERLKKNGQVVFQYCNEEAKLADYPYNPNGSIDNIAGICDETGRVLGLMPHPERHIGVSQHPRWTGLRNKPRSSLKSPIALKEGRGKNEGDGIEIFKNGVEYARKYL
ncbi:MAG: phosphoribosylformylglycinamidine synthase I [Candidatus Omnitrophota bacterium]|nr:phosphoribosylformylglycinamidine synthase I [Candidatus Omnitrophota bacterium]